MTDLRPAPYPSDTRAKGWRFEVDYEKVDQSDTWSLAGEIPLARACLTMMWLSAWTQEPCGSLPNDENVIRSRCQIPQEVWPSVRSILMRGWWLAEDGRLYHDTLTKRVLEMLDYRRKNAERVANFKAAKREQQAGNALPKREQHDKNDTGTGTSSSPTSKKEPRKRVPPPESPPDVDAQVWADWHSLRKAKKAPVTQTVLDGARSEAAKAGMTFEAFLRVWCRRGTQGLEAAWLKPHERSQGPPSRKDTQLETAALMTGARNAQPPGEIIDVTPRILAA